jgi:hypothetical protein
MEAKLSCSILTNNKGFFDTALVGEMLGEETNTSIGGIYLGEYER